MEYGYRFDDEAPRYELRTLWFLLGVVVFAFSVLIVASMMNGSGPGRMHLTEPATKQQQVVPAKPVGSRGVSPAATPVPARPVNSKGG